MLEMFNVEKFHMEFDDPFNRRQLLEKTCQRLNLVNDRFGYSSISAE